MYSSIDSWRAWLEKSKNEILKLKELPNERLEGSWVALWLGIRTFFGFKLESRNEILPQSRQHDDFDRTQTGLETGNTHFPDIF